MRNANAGNVLHATRLMSTVATHPRGAMPRYGYALPSRALRARAPGNLRACAGAVRRATRDAADCSGHAYRQRDLSSRRWAAVRMLQRGMAAWVRRQVLQSQRSADTRRGQVPGAPMVP